MRVLSELDYAPIELGAPMTIIAAMRCSDHLLLGADSLATEDDGTGRPVSKLRSLSNIPLAWGFAGDEGVGNDFSRWLTTYHWPEQNWGHFKNVAIAELSRLNGEKRRLIALAGTTERTGDTASALLVGYVGHEAGILSLDERGGATLVEERFTAIGSGMRSAWTAYYALRIALGERFSRNEQNFRALIETAAELTRDCRPPVHILCIRPDGIFGPVTGGATGARRAIRGHARRGVRDDRG